MTYSEIKEEWRPVKGYEGYYEVSNIGNVRSIDRVVVRKNHLAKISGKVLKLNINIKTGYPCVNLVRNGSFKTFAVHRLVIEAFVGTIPKGMQVDHINTIRNDNRLENLRVVTQSENNLNPITHSRAKAYKPSTETIEKTRIANTDNPKLCKRVIQYSQSGDFIATFISTVRAAQSVNGFPQMIGRCCLGKKKTAYGFVWKYA